MKEQFAIALTAMPRSLTGWTGKPGAQQMHPSSGVSACWSVVQAQGGAAHSVSHYPPRCRAMKAESYLLVQIELFDHRIRLGNWSFPVYVLSSGKVTLMSDESTILPEAVGRL